MICSEACISCRGGLALRDGAVSTGDEILLCRRRDDGGQAGAAGAAGQPAAAGHVEPRDADGVGASMTPYPTWP